MSSFSLLTACRNRLLEEGYLYDFLQGIVGSKRARRHFVEHFAVLPSNARVLDIGCGPGTLIPFLGERLSAYVGFDHNPRYVQMAQERFGRKSYHFFRADVSTARECLKERGLRFDAVLAAAVLHHLDDHDAVELLDLAVTFCAPGGFFASFDGAIIQHDNPIATAILRADRGRHVRTPEAYEALLRSRFSDIKCEVRRDLMRVPYTLVFFRASPHSPGGLSTAL